MTMFFTWHTKEPRNKPLNMERERLKNIALKKVQQEKPKVQPCTKCGHDSFLFDFRRPVTTKTCKNNLCKAVEVVEVL